MTQVLEDPREALRAGRAAFRRHDWSTALELLTIADEAGEIEPDDLERLAEAAWWGRQLDRTIRYRERAYTAHLRAGHKGPAASAALSLVPDYIGKLKMTLALGALRRAQRVLADEPEGPFHAQLAAIEGMLASQEGSFERAVELSRRARAIAQRFGAVDLEVFGLLVEGSARVSKGEVDEGLALLDEATSMAVGGELTPMFTGITYCMTIGACRGVAAFDRAGQWTDAAEMWCEQEGIASGFPGLCRVHRAEIKHFKGDWAEAEEEAARAAEELMNFSEDVVGAAQYEIAEVRRKRGDLDGAEEAYRAAVQFQRSPEPGMSLLRLARGEGDAAASSIQRALAEANKPLERFRMLPAQVEIALATGDVDTAHVAAGELEEVAENYSSPSPVLKATAAYARAQVHLAEGKPEQSISCLQGALRDWWAVGAPYETAQTHAVLASAYEALGDAGAATFELEAAIATFDRLGAQPEAGAARERFADLTRPEEITRTFMFTDVVRSTRMITKIGDEAWAQLLRAHDRALRGAFKTFDGEEVDHAGDGFFVAFADPARAVDCALAIQDVLSDEATFGELKVRVGVHLAVALRHGRTYRGGGVHTASRIAGKAAAGEVLVSRDTVTAAGRTKLISETRVERLRGVPVPVELAVLKRSAA